MTCPLYAKAIKEVKTRTGIACMHTPRFLVLLIEEKHTHTYPATSRNTIDSKAFSG